MRVVDTTVQRRVTGLTLMSGPGGYGRNYTLLGQMGARDTQ